MTTKVHATTGNVNLSDISNVISAQFYNNTNNNLSEVPTDRIDMDFGSYYMSHNEITTYSTGYGAAVMFSIDKTLLKDYYYAITIYVQNYNGVQLRFVPNYGNRLIACYSGTHCYNSFINKTDNTTIYFAGNNVTTITGVGGGQVTAFTYVISINDVNANYFLLPFTSFSNSTSYYQFLGYNIEIFGQKDLVTNSSLQTAISNSGLATAESVNEVNNSINNMQTSINSSIDEQTQQDKEQYDEFMNSDISDEDKELPDDSKYQDYTDTENDLKDKVNEADMSVISIGIDANSSVWVWDTLTRLIQSNSIVFGMFIAILSIGIIKLALGR